MLLANFNRWSGVEKLIKHFKCKVGIEVGTRECFYADHILKNTEIEKLYALDIEELKDYTTTVKNLYGPRFQFVLGKSPEYASKFPDSFFDFIYIDAGHTYEEVKADLNAWWSKLKHQFVFMGDDYMIDPDNTYGVIEAVNEFVKEKNQDLYVTGIPDGPNTFDYYKEWAEFNSKQAWRNNAGKPNLFIQNVQWYIIKQ